MNKKLKQLADRYTELSIELHDILSTIPDEEYESTVEEFYTYINPAANDEQENCDDNSDD